MAHTRAERRWFRQVKGLRRLTQDKQQHRIFGQQTLEEACACFTQPGSKAYGRVFARFADTPKVCSFGCCGNPRKWLKEVTRQERKMAMSEREQRRDLAFSGESA